MKIFLKSVIVVITLTGTAIFVMAQAPGVPAPPVGVIPWNSELITGVGILFFGLISIVRRKLRK